MFQVVNLVKVRIIIIYISYLSGKLVIENLKYLTIFKLWDAIIQNVNALTV